MLDPISGVSPNPVHLSPANAHPAATSLPKLQPATSSHPDAVKLSLTQRVRELRAEGEPAGQIAASLDLTASQVNNDLYVSLTWPQLLSKVASGASFGGITAASTQS